MPEKKRSSPALGVCYYPEHWDESRWPEDLRRMHDLGIRFVRVGEFAWSRFEPEPASYNFAWLERFLDLVKDAELAAVVGTPTASPPKWLVDSMPDMIALDKNGLPRAFGSRRHYCFSHEGYRVKCQQIVTQLAKAVGTHSAVYAWQVDNEYGCHDTAISFSPAARSRFRQWLQERYGDIASLNGAWRNVFWSMEYRHFDEIELPNRTPTDPNPAHALDFRRFSSEMVRQFQRLQVDILRQHSPGRAITHNFMAGFTEFEHFNVAADLDFASWDSYPLGFLASFPLFSETHRRHFMRSGDPDYVALHHDLYRACGRGRWWVMEQQPGPVNWAPYNPAPLPGMVRLWALEAFAHGAEVVSFFRWRQAPFGQEQYHSGLNLPTGEADSACTEITQLKEELSLFAGEETQPADVALVFDYEAAWAIDIQPQSSEFVYLGEAFRFYRAVRRLGLNVDVVSQEADLAGYRLILVPPLPIVRPEFVDALRRSSGLIVFGPRLGSKSVNFCIPENLPPGLLQELLPLRVLRVDSLPRFAPKSLQWNGKSYVAENWVEQVASKLEPLARFEDGQGALFRHERFLYLAGLPGDQWLADLINMVAHQQDLQIIELPDGVRTRRIGALQCFFNYNPFPVQLSGLEGLDILAGNADLPPAGVLIGRERKPR